MADYPTIIPNFGADEIDGVDFNYAAHINKLRAEVRAIATELGTRLISDPAASAKLATALAEATTLLGHFDGGGLLPHTGIEGVVGATRLNNPLNYPNDFDAINYGEAGFRVTADGMCEWYGLVYPNESGLNFFGAPAPADGFRHSFSVTRRGPGILPFTLGPLWAPYALYDGTTAGYAWPGFYITPDGMCHLSGSIYNTGTVAPGALVADLAGQNIPIPSDGAIHVFNKNNVAQLYNLSVGPAGLTFGPFGPTLGVAGVPAPFSLDGMEYYVGTDGDLHIDVYPDGTGRFVGPLGQYGNYIGLDNVSYFVGP